MRIQHNIAALNSYRQLGGNNNATSKNLEKLSSGYKINRAGDDAAGLAISEKMRAQITGLEKAQDNANDGISLVQTAEGALTEVHSMLNRMTELAEQSANGTYDNTTDRANLQKEIKSLTSEIDRISKGTNFNGIKLLDGSLDSSVVGSAVTAKAGAGLSFKAGADAGNIVISTSTAGTKTDGTDKKATATIGTDGSLTLGFVQEAAGGTDIEYTADDINKAVSDAVKNTTVTDANKVKLDALKSFNASGTYTAAKNGTPDGTQTVTMAAKTLDNGDTAKALTLQIGETSETFNKLDVNIGDMSAAALGIDKIDISTQDGAAAAMDKIKAAINTVSSTRGDIGANQNRLEHTINNLSVTSENVTAAESRIRDTDMAKEMMNYTKNNILIQASQSMLAQANQMPQGVLQLLQ